LETGGIQHLQAHSHTQSPLPGRLLPHHRKSATDCVRFTRPVTRVSVGPQPSPKSHIALSVSTRVVLIQYSPQPRNETLVLIGIFPAKGSSLGPCPAFLGLSELVLQRLHLHAAKRISGFRFGVQHLEGVWREIRFYASSTEKPHKFYRVKFFVGHYHNFFLRGKHVGHR
jgi:hypothetical protein